jgi:hypothetical protein
MIVVGHWGRCSEMHIEISFLKEAMLMGSSCAERRRCQWGFLALRRCRWGFLVLRRRFESVFQYISIDLICQGKHIGLHWGSCETNGLGE